MSINTAYFGSESNWLDFPPVKGMTDSFKTGQYSTVNHSDYGLATRTWLACKYGSDIDAYKQPLDKSFGWCSTDGSAPFDHTYGVTGYNAKHDRYELNQNGKNVIGLGAYGTQSAYISNMDYVQYYKTSATGSSTFSSVPLNFNPEYEFSPKIDNYNSNSLKVMRCAGSGLSPVLKFDFGYYYMIPFVDYYVLKSTVTISDWKAVTDPKNYSTLVDTSKRDDLYTFYTRINSGTYSSDKIIINGIVGYMVHVAWNDDNTYDISDISFGTRTNTTCQITLIHANDTPIDFTFNDWYDTTDPTQYSIKIDPVFINNKGQSVGGCGIYDGKTSSISSGQFTAQTAILLAGCVTHYAIGYTSPSKYCYNYQPVVMGSNDFTAKTFSADSSLPDTSRYSISVSATLSDFGGLESFREYVRRCCAYFGCYFTEKFYPNATKDWLESDCFIGTIDESGFTHGDYTHGVDNAQQSQREWGENWSRKTPYKPNSQPKPVAPSSEKASSPLTLRPNANIGVGMGLMRYAVKPNDLFNIGVWLNAVTNYNKAINSFVSKYVTDNPSASENKAMKAFKNVFPDVNSWYAYVYSKLGNGVHPNNNIVGLMAFPFETNRFGVGTATGILMGDSNTGSSPQFECKSWYEDETPINTTFTLSDITTAVGKPVNSDGFAELEMGSMDILPEYGDFRDYAPYTKLELQIPYFGTVNLDPKEWYYHTVYVKCICECVTGSALCIVCRGDDYGNVVPVVTIGGQIGFSIPLNIDSYGGTTASLTASSASFQNMNIEHRVNAVNGLIDVGKSTASLIGAGAFTVVTGGLGVGALALAGANVTQKASSYYGQMKTEKNNIKATEYAMEHQQAGSMILGSASPSANAKYEYQCRLVKHYPCMLNTSLSEFIANNGVACMETGIVGDYSGYTVFSNVKLDSIDLTDEEKKIIETTLQSGVYI